MAVVFTPEQQKVIDIRDKNILVSAAAGSGKTAVLTERIIQKVCDEEHPVDIDRMLVVTFTNAAAAEMRERVAKKLSQKLLENPESEHIQRQATLLHNAQITTIDSFCLFLLRNHFNEIGLDPAFRIADEGEIQLMQQDVLAELLEDKFALQEEEFQACVEYFCPDGKEKNLENHILNLSHFASAFPWPEKWLQERKNDYNTDTPEKIDNSSYGKYLTVHVADMVQGILEKLILVEKLCEEPDGPYMYGEMVDGEIEQLEKLKNCKTLSEYAVCFAALEFGRLSSKKDDSVNPVKRELASGLRSEVKESIRKLREQLFDIPLESVARQCTEIQKPLNTLLDLVLEFDVRMAKRKQEKKIIDFSDAEHFALDILLSEIDGKIVPSSVALEYRQYFDEILIDEYQDSNLVQEYLLQAISGEDEGHFNRFMVGDVKQSIYRFRLARPELFLEKYNNYSGLDEEDMVRIDLAKNFRSRREVVDSINAVFSGLMSKRVGGIVYDEKAALYPGADYPESRQNETELVLVDKSLVNTDSSEKELEAKAVADKIKQLRAEFLVTDGESKELRNAKYSDMVILLRTNAGWDEVFKNVLEEEGIPAYVTTKSGYFGATEVQELLQVLRVLDNPYQDIPLFGVMKSLFGNFTEEEIARIRSFQKNCLLYEALKAYAGQNTKCDDESETQNGQMPWEQSKTEQKDLIEKANLFLEAIQKYRHLMVYMSVRELLTVIVTDYDYLNYVTALPAGSKRRANVEMLFTRASDFEKTSYFGLFHFVRYIEQLEEYDVDFGEAEILDETADVVRIMSIHKSKGLEFPITFVCGMGKGFNLQDVNRSVVYDMDLGIGIDYMNVDKRIKSKSFRRYAISRKLREDTLAEELRVLYVAMTRAREKLILTAHLKDTPQTLEKYKEMQTEQIAYSDFFESTCYLDFLLPILNRTGIAVSVLVEESMKTEALREQIELGVKKTRLDSLDIGMEKEIKLLKKRLEAEYAYRNLSDLYTKTTVSELKIAAMADKDEEAYHTFEEKEVQPYIPTFRREEDTVTGTVRGNAYHRVMELLDFKGLWQEILSGQMEQDRTEFPREYETYVIFMKKLNLKGIIQHFLEDETKSGRLKQEYFDAVRLEKITDFLDTELAYRMWRAEISDKLYREQPFVLGISAARLNEKYPDSEKVLIQGIIDAFFEEEDGLVLLDYKTDSVDSMKELWNRYDTQLQYYEEALTKLRNRPVKEKYLYSFKLGKYRP